MTDCDGWIKLHRKMMHWVWYRNGNALRLFLHLLLTSANTPKKWRGITVNRGQVVTSLSKLSVSLGISIQSLRTSISTLKSTNELTSKTNSEYTVFTINNYDYYQRDNKPTNRLTNTVINKGVTTNKKYIYKTKLNIIEKDKDKEINKEKEREKENVCSPGTLSDVRKNLEAKGVIRHKGGLNA